MKRINLKKLISLKVSQCHAIENIEPLADLPYLSKLDISDCKLLKSTIKEYGYDFPLKRPYGLFSNRKEVENFQKNIKNGLPN